MKSKRQSKRCIMSCVGCVNNWHATDILLYYNVAKNFMKLPDSNHYYYTPTFSRDNLFKIITLFKLTNTFLYTKMKKKL